MCLSFSSADPTTWMSVPARRRCAGESHNAVGALFEATLVLVARDQTHLDTLLDVLRVAHPDDP
jgi:hypothetical protein